MNNKETTSLQALEEQMEKLDQRLAAIEFALERQKGFIGGLLFVASIIAYFLSNIKEMMGWLK